MPKLPVSNPPPPSRDVRERRKASDSQTETPGSAQKNEATSVLEGIQSVLLGKGTQTVAQRMKQEPGSKDTVCVSPGGGGNVGLCVPEGVQVAHRPGSEDVSSAADSCPYLRPPSLDQLASKWDPIKCVSRPSAGHPAGHPAEGRLPGFSR